MSKTIVKIEDSKYGKMFAVHTVLGVAKDDKEILAEKPLVKFGLRKASVILDNIEELKAFVEENVV